VEVYHTKEGLRQPKVMGFAGKSHYGRLKGMRGQKYELFFNGLLTTRQNKGED